MTISYDEPVMAHRGASGYSLENTMSAFRHAVELGAKAVELDAHISKDRIPVVFHDDTLKRLAGRPEKIKELTAEELASVELINGERIPLLSDVLDEFKKKLLINIEIKDWLSVPHVVRCVESHRARNSVVISSFDFKALELAHSMDPGLEIIPIMGTRTIKPQVRLREAFPLGIIKKLGARWLHIAFQLTNKRLVAKLHRNGIKIRTWTVNNAGKMRKLIEIGVDGLITDYPDVALGIYLPQKDAVSADI
ncbi:MAG: glycerophosphodiester phosphodiesterase [Planctomycetes bacterium]|nr:glycerophosphodiester phosphodiesterase [Planctomycetota bacterium]